MSFRRAVLLALALTTTAAMAQDGPSTASTAAGSGAQMTSSAGAMLSGDAKAGQAKAAVCSTQNWPARTPPTSCSS
jgi:hypothetical protein